MGSEIAEDSWAQRVVKFWFDTLSPKDWFQPPTEVDAEIVSQFSDLPDEIFGKPDAVLLTSPYVALAAIVALDQFPRNLYRGTERAFAYDERALGLAKAVVARGFDRDDGLSTDQRVFMYLPFEHSESIADQEQAVILIRALGNDVYTQYAVAHRDVIARFGRFPHRNKILARDSTEQEAEFLLQPGSSF